MGFDRKTANGAKYHSSEGANYLTDCCHSQMQKILKIQTLFKCIQRYIFEHTTVYTLPVQIMTVKTDAKHTDQMLKPEYSVKQNTTKSSSGQKLIINLFVKDHTCI